MIALDELRVPRGLRPVVEEIAGITDSVCLTVLDEEYADLARRAVAKLARKRPSPLQAGRRATWAAGVVYALGHVNFLSDPASQPCVTADQLSAAFGVAKSTMSSKSQAGPRPPADQSLLAGVPACRRSRAEPAGLDH